MRIGANPLKDRQRQNSGFWHRVISPVYIPKDAGFFKEASDVLETMLASLFRTTGSETGITIVVNDASERCRRVIEKASFESDRIDVIWKAQNVGKVEAIFSAFRGYHEPLVTVTDCDVLFRPGWLEKTVEVFDRLPMVGAVSALPVPHLRRQHTTTTYLGAALRGQLADGPFALESDMRLYMADLQSPRLIPDPLMSRQVAIAVNGFAVLVGCTHMQCTYRREALKGAPTRECTAAMGADSERLWMDEPPDRTGWWKVSLPEAYVRHMGNVVPENVPMEWTAGRAPVVRKPRQGQRSWEAHLPFFVRNLAGRAIQRLMEARLFGG